LSTIDGFRVLFYSYEGSPREPLHVHVRKAECQAKVWIEPAIRLDASYGFNSAEERRIIQIVTSNVDDPEAMG
jgi:hypothetical protein